MKEIHQEIIKNKTFDVVLAFLMGMSIAIIISKIWN